MERGALDRNLWAVVPMSEDVVRSNKAVLLEEIKREASDGFVSESILENLEILEALERSQGNAIPESMRAVYCMVALECTVKFLVSSGGKPREKYSKALNRIWRGRIGRLESLGTSQLLSDELKKLRDELNSVFNNENVCRKLCRMNTRNDALLRICAYLEEACAGLNLMAKQEQPEKKTDQLQFYQQVDDDAKPNPSQSMSSSHVNVVDVDVEIGNEAKVAEHSTSTAHAHMDELNNKSIDHSHETTANQPIPEAERATVSPPKMKMMKNETKKRRKNRRWSLHEEQILRTAVESFGPSWKYILVVHRDDFEGRTVVDLKDKWRNMTKNLRH